MSWFRSEPMEYVSIILQEHIARDVIDQLGDIGAVQFVDVSCTGAVWFPPWMQKQQ